MPTTGPGIGRPRPRTITSPANWQSRIRLRLAIMRPSAVGNDRIRSPLRTLVNVGPAGAPSPRASASRRGSAISVPVMVAIRVSTPSCSA